MHKWLLCWKSMNSGNKERGLQKRLPVALSLSCALCVECSWDVPSWPWLCQGGGDADFAKVFFSTASELSDAFQQRHKVKLAKFILDILDYGEYLLDVSTTHNVNLIEEWMTNTTAGHRPSFKIFQKRATWNAQDPQQRESTWSKGSL